MHNANGTESVGPGGCSAQETAVNRRYDLVADEAGALLEQADFLLGGGFALEVVQVRAAFIEFVTKKAKSNEEFKPRCTWHLCCVSWNAEFGARQE